MLSKTAWISMLVIGAVSVMGMTACAHKRHTPEEKAEWFVKRVASKLDLNELQKAKLDEAKAVFLRGASERQQQHQMMMDELITQIESEKLDNVKLTGLITGHVNERLQELPTVMEKLSEFHATLDADQKQKMIKKLKKFKERGHHH